MLRCYYFISRTKMSEFPLFGCLMLRRMKKNYYIDDFDFALCDGLLLVLDLDRIRLNDTSTSYALHGLIFMLYQLCS